MTDHEFEPDRQRELDRDQLLGLLTDLGAELQSMSLHAKIHVIGGAAIALTLDDARSTADIDAVVLVDHPREFHAAAVRVAERNGVPPTWMSDDVSDFVSRHPDGEETCIELPGLDVFVASPQHLLALKVRAATTRDARKDSRDLVMLASHLGLETPEAIADLTEKQFQGIYFDRIGRDEYLGTAREALLEDLLERGERDGTKDDPTMLAKLSQLYGLGDDDPSRGSDDYDEAEDYERW